MIQTKPFPMVYWLLEFMRQLTSLLLARHGNKPAPFELDYNPHVLRIARSKEKHACTKTGEPAGGVTGVKDGRSQSALPEAVHNKSIH